jgi:hypothetical protein
VTQEDIRRLLGGYATNTLTEGERTALFEAALDDQDLFDALHNEEALRELLADPVSREQIRQALEPARRVPWMRRPWLIGTASLAVAAVIAIAVLTWHREPARDAPARQAAPSQIAQAHIEPKLGAPPPALVIPAPARRAAARAKAQPARLAARPAAALALDAPLYSGPLVRYSVLRSGPSGDAVRIEVVSELAGSLALYRADAAGQWQRVFPAKGPGLSIAANASYQIPDDPIVIRGNQKTLRLVIEPAARPAIAAQLATGSLNEPRAKTLDKKTTAPAPLVIEIPIGPN